MVLESRSVRVHFPLVAHQGTVRVVLPRTRFQGNDAVDLSAFKHVKSLSYITAYLGGGIHGVLGIQALRVMICDEFIQNGEDHSSRKFDAQGKVGRKFSRLTKIYLCWFRPFPSKREVMEH